MKKIEESAENTANTMNDEQCDLENANNNSSHMETLIKCKSENDISAVSHKSAIENNSKEKESTHIKNGVNTVDYQNVHGKKRTFEQCNDNAEIINNNNKENPNIINELEIKNNLKALFNINEEDYNYSQIQNIFIFLEITREYKPNLMEQTCYDCLICFLNDFKNNMHEKLLIEKVTLTTIHKSKGLEWKVVFIINVIEGEIPHVSANNNEIIEERKIFYKWNKRKKGRFFNNKLLTLCEEINDIENFQKKKYGDIDNINDIEKNKQNEDDKNSKDANLLPFTNTFDAPNALLFENLNKEYKYITTQDNFDGFRFEVDKNVNKYLQSTHTLFLGTSLRDVGYLYQFGANFASSDNTLLMISRVNLDGSVNGRFCKKINNFLDCKFNFNTYNKNDPRN
ncbi:ATP-dependent DNA helicase UvrD, putative (UvrD), partial [Plasmodium ovale curtisi]